MDNPKRCIHRDLQGSPASSQGGPKEPDSPGNSSVVIFCAGRGRSSVGSPRERSCPGLLHHPPVLMCRGCLCPVTGIHQVCRGEGKSPPQPWDMVQMHYEKAAPSVSLEKRGDGATEAPIWDHLVSLSFTPAVPAPTHIFFGCTLKVSCASEEPGGTEEEQGGICRGWCCFARNNIFLQQRRMELEPMQLRGSAKWYLPCEHKAA